MKSANPVKKTRKELDAIIRTIPDIVYRLDGDGYITFISRSIEKYGYQPESLIGKCIIDLVHPQDKRQAVYRINERRTGIRRTESFEIRLLVKHDEEVSSAVFFVTAEGLYSSDDPSSRTFLGTQGIMRDITCIRELQKEQLEREKLQGVIEMAGAACHELTQPMQSISGFSEVLLMQLPVDNPLYKKIARINQQIIKMAEITRKMMLITRYETKEYTNGQKIIDIDKSAEIKNMHLFMRHPETRDM